MWTHETLPTHNNQGEFCEIPQRRMFSFVSTPFPDWAATADGGPGQDSSGADDFVAVSAEASPSYCCSRVRVP